MAKWMATDELLNTNAIAGVVTAQPISFPVAVAVDPNSIRVDARVSAITALGTQTLILEEYTCGAWSSVASIPITATGVYSIKINGSSTTKIPLASQIRVSITQDNAGASCTFSSATVYRFV